MSVLLLERRVAPCSERRSRRRGEDTGTRDGNDQLGRRRRGPLPPVISFLLMIKTEYISTWQ